MSETELKTMKKFEDESDGEWNSRRENRGWMTGRCTVKNSHTTWVRGCRGTSWKTWSCKTKYSGTNTVKDKVHSKTKYCCTNWVKKNSWQFAFNISLLCNVFDFLFENLPLNKMYNVFSSCFSMYSTSLALFNFDIEDLFCVKYQETRNISLLQYQTPTSLLKNETISEFFLNKLKCVLRSYSQYLYWYLWFETNPEYLKRKSRWNLA